MEWALERLGVDEAVFDAVVCFETMNPHLFGDYAHAVDRRPAKPVVDAIVAGLRAAGSNPRRTLFLDDSERNIATRKALGLRTALVRNTTILTVLFSNTFLPCSRVRVVVGGSSGGWHTPHRAIVMEY
ncbi:uncharacterized protein [Zea mays]|uniref:uncharacterized protein n=1 Tax=Zea mays TaxID=4577 RepID=UPI0004DEC9DF|nr:uncharacterized protein LOC103631485 [Zea mays]|eukprot:XP_008650607.1 uncharacterized protein LOC103631485 [Zea mays]